MTFDHKSLAFYGYPDRFVKVSGEQLTVYYALDVKAPHAPLPPGADMSGWVEPVSYTLYDAVFKAVVRRGKLLVRGPHGRVSYHPCESHRGDGANYPWSSVFDTSGLTPGVYKIQLWSKKGITSLDICFVVRESVSKLAVEVGIVFPTFTLHAYNRMGGASLYHPPESLKMGEVHVSLKRPFAYTMVRQLSRGHLGHHTVDATLEYIRAIRRLGRSFVCTDSLDVHENRELLKRCKLVLLTGHDEYMTQKIRGAIDSFVDSGGKLAVFSGNTCDWRVRLDGDEISCTKGGLIDSRPNAAHRTGKWHNKGIDDPVERTFGLAFRFGGFPVERFLAQQNNASEFPVTSAVSAVAGGMQVQYPEHPLYAGTGLSKGDWFCTEDRLIAIESDGIPLNVDDTADPTRMLDPPKSIRILAAAYLGSRGTYNYGVKKVGSLIEFDIGDNGGKVINFGSIGWYNVVSATWLGHRIFRNAIDYLIGRGDHVIPLGGIEWFWYRSKARCEKFVSFFRRRLRQLKGRLARNLR